MSTFLDPPPLTSEEKAALARRVDLPDPARLAYKDAFPPEYRAYVAALLTAALETNPAVATAAINAIAAAVAGLHVATVENLEISTLDPDPTVSGEVDALGRRSWRETAPDGGPTANAIRRIAAKLLPGVLPDATVTDIAARGLAAVGLEPRSTLESDYADATVDSNGRIAWTAVMRDGGPSAAAMQMISARLVAALMPLAELSTAVLADAGISPDSGIETPLLEATLDTNNRVAWTAIDADGGPTAAAVEQIFAKAPAGLALGPGSVQDTHLGITAGSILETTGAPPNRKLWATDVTTGTRTLLVNAGDPSGAYLTRDNQAVYTDSASVVRIVPAAGGTIRRALSALDRIAAYGDSLTAAGNWEARVSALTGLTISNRGKSGQTSTDRAIEQGGLVPLVTVAGNTIPASGAVAATLNLTGSFRSNVAGGMPNPTFTGTLAGVPGTLTEDIQTGAAVWTFTRTASGAATACPPGTPFLVAANAAADQPQAQVLWVGRNNPSSQANVLRDVAAMVAFLRAAVAVPRFLIVGVTNGAGEGSATTTYTQITQINAALAAAYPTQFLDIRRRLIDRGLADAGIAPTTQDLADIAADLPPSSLRTDAIHYTAAGYNVIGDGIAEKLTQLGWV